MLGRRGAADPALTSRSCLRLRPAQPDLRVPQDHAQARTCIRRPQGIALSIAADLAGPAAQDLRRTDTLSAELRQAGGAVVVDDDERALRVAGEPQQPVVEKGDLATSVAGVLAAALGGLLVRRSALRPMQRLVSDAAHDLTSLRMNVDLLAEDLRRNKLALEQRATVLGDLQGQATELNNLLVDLVHVARDDTAATSATVDVRDVVESSLTRVRRRAQGATFDVELAPLFVLANADALERAVLDVLDNAVRWSPPGGTIRGPAAGRPASGLRCGAGHRRGRPALRLRPLLPRGVGTQDQGHRPGSVHRGHDGRGDGRFRRGRPVVRPRAAPS